MSKVTIPSHYAHSEDRSRFLNLIVRDGYVKEFPVRLKRRDGTVIDALLTGVPQKNPDGTLKALIGTARDISERKRAEEALRESEEVFREVFNNAHDALFLHEMLPGGLPGQYFRVNDIACKRLGYSREELCKMSPRDIVSSQQCLTIPGIAATLKSGGYAIFETIHERKDGSSFPVEVSTHIFTLQGRQVALSIARDITGRRHAEEALLHLTEFQDSVITNARVWLTVLDQKGKILIWNTAAEEISGYRSEEVTGKNEIWKLIYPEKEYRKQITDTITRIIRDRKYLENFETIIRSRQGNEKVISWNTKGIPDATGKISDYIAIGMDVTDRVVAEAALRGSEERYRDVVEDQTEFICRFLPDCTHIFVNDAYCRYFSRKREELIGHRFRPVLHPEDREQVARHFASLTPQHPVMNIDHRIIMPDSSTRWQRWSDRAIFGENGRVIEYQSVGRDISVQKELEKEMEYHEQELRKFSTSLAMANKKLTLLSSITRHDINNQLSVLVGYLRILENKQLDTSYAEYFQKIDTAAQRISTMIRFTKEYEKIGVNAPDWQDCRTLIDTAAKQALLGKVMVKNDLPAGTEVFADPLVIKVFYNLMDNAVRYGQKITTIRFSVQESGDNPLVVCEDDGVGVPAEEKEKIFERGYGKNTGMGLFLAREILDITGITIRENGEPGTGARFEIHVPNRSYRMKRDDEV
jgi:PAS domain S-box-containing protein